MCYAFNKIERNDKTERHEAEAKAATGKIANIYIYSLPMKMRWIVDKKKYFFFVAL